jgi:aryl-alcohol dehydrogenase-like predicted oxidoreductase
VTKLWLGTMHFGTAIDERTAFGLLDRFADRGGTHVDTANCYATWAGTGDESEELIGRWHTSRRARDRIVLATKVGARPTGSDRPWPFNAEGLSDRTIRTATEASLRRLRTEHVDVLYGHMQDPEIPVEESVAAFAGLVDDGLARRIGLSNHTTWRVERARAAARALGRGPLVELVQQRYSYLQPRPGAPFGTQLVLSDEMRDYALSTPDLTLLGYSPLLNGAYTRSDRELMPHYTHIGTEHRLTAVREVARALGATPNQVVLAWMLGSTPAVVPVIGVSTAEQLDECLGALDVTIPADLRRAMDETA